MILTYHMIAFLAGYVLDLIVGDPTWFPHPVKGIGKMISALEKRWNKPDKQPSQLVHAGAWLVVVVVAVTVVIAAAVLAIAYMVNVWVGVVVEAAITCMCLSTKDLRKQSMKVYRCLAEGDLAAAQVAVSWIVGRDTEVLDEAGVAKAAIETVAENTADGVIAPMVYTAIGGPVLGMAYKAINTMDSMVAYKNERFLHFGRVAAKLDDIANFVPSRLGAMLMVAATWLLRVLGIGGGRAIWSASRAYAIFRRDRFKHRSPNSAQTESVCAGALGVQLAGPISYFGVMNEKPYIGDDLRPVEFADIRRANQLLYMTSLVCVVACLVVMGIVALAI